MLQWNGSEITELLTKAKIQEGIYHKTVYWKLTWRSRNKKTKRIREISEYCIVKNLTHGLLPCLMDEIKPLFGLHKIGTHWAKHSSKKYLLLRVKTDQDDRIIYDLSLDRFEWNSHIAPEVKKIFAFRELLGMSKSYESSIIVRINHVSVHVISFYDPNMEPSSHNAVIPKTVLEKWFTDTTVDQEIQKLVGIDTLEQLGEKLFFWRQGLVKIVERCDPESILLIDEMLSRISARLQHCLY